MRLASGGRLIDRTRALRFRFNGTELTGYSGDTLASALLANDQVMVGRSFKYHRPRGIVASGPEEPNALVTLGEGGRLEPNQRATVTELVNGMTAVSQNHWPSLKLDVGSMSDRLSKLLPAGFYYKTFMWPRPAWANLYEPLIRRAAGLGKPPKERDPDRYEHCHVHVDVLVVGGGVAGLQAARIAARSGASVLVVEQSAVWGGRLLNDCSELEGAPAADWLESCLEELRQDPRVRLLGRTTGLGVYDHGYVVAGQRLGEANSAPGGVRQRLWRIRASRVVLATGAIERPVCFAGNDVPGVMLASAVRDYILDYGVSPGDRTVVLTNNDDAYRTAFVMVEAGLSVPAILDTRLESTGSVRERARQLGIRVEAGMAIAGVKGRTRVAGISVCSQAGEGAVLKELECECVAMSGGWSPTIHLWSHCGGRLCWNSDRSMFLPDPERPPKDAKGNQLVYPVGGANGRLGARAALADSMTETRRICHSPDPESAEDVPPPDEASEECATEPAWTSPNGLDARARSRAWVDFQNDVKVSDLELAVREGYTSAEHAKRYTTLGMATDQGKLSNVNGVALLSRVLCLGECEAGTTTFRPPYTPVPLGAIAGDAAGELFKPLRKTPIDAWHEQNGAHWEPVSDWRRPYCYLASRTETVQEAVNRETLAVRNSVGMLDATTLGKIIVRGSDAGKFLDMLYTNVMSSLKPGSCRYGLMCNENGFIIDDGVVARLDADTFLCHTTTGGADHIHGWMEEWLQCEWWKWDVFAANVTDQFAQIGVAGPKARDLLRKLGGMDVGADAMPFMSWAEGGLGKFSARIFRISFSGEISFEVAVPANEGLDLWNTLIDAGQEFSVQPYGTEALHVLRAEKGYIMIGDETDGTVTPQDLGMNWIISKVKTDYLGKRAQQRSHLTDPGRWKLVGLRPVEPKAELPAGSHAIEDAVNDHGQTRMVGRVTSSYFSPVLNRTIALGLVERGPDRMGETLGFSTANGPVSARICETVQYDPEGSRLHG